MDLWKKHWNMAETKIPAENLLMQLFLSHDVFAILTLKDTPRREWGAAIKSDKKQTRTMTYANVSRAAFSRIHCLTRTMEREREWSVGNSCYHGSLNGAWPPFLPPIVPFSAEMIPIHHFWPFCRNWSHNWRKRNHFSDSQFHISEIGKMNRY